jgi:effector-binding domain-containing protein
MRRDLYSIGEFSMVSRMSVKTLRFYDEQGLLKPAHIDPKSGYRYYSSAQLAEANLIRLLRSLELPLDEIQLFLRESDIAKRVSVLEKHHRKMEKRLVEYNSIISSIESLIEGKESEMERKVETKEMADQPVLGKRFRTSLEKIETDIGNAFQSIFSCLGESGQYPSGPPFALYYGMEFDEKDIEMEICVPVGRIMGGKDDVDGREVAGGLMASTLHMGPYHQVAEAYQVLDLWIKENGYEYAGPAREIYLVGMGQVEDEADYRTEVLISIAKAGG